MAKFGDGGELVKCSFCGKAQKQVKNLIAGPGVYICDECVELCNEIIEPSATRDGAPAALTTSPWVTRVQAGHTMHVGERWRWSAEIVRAGRGPGMWPTATRASQKWLGDSAPISTLSIPAGSASRLSRRTKAPASGSP